MRAACWWSTRPASSRRATSRPAWPGNTRGPRGGSRIARSASSSATRPARPGAARPGVVPAQGMGRGPGAARGGGRPRAGPVRHEDRDGQADGREGVDAGVKAAWLTADAVYGSDYGFRSCLEGRGLGYVVGVRADFAAWRGFRQVRAKALLAGLPAGAWRRLSCGDGSKGPRLYEWAALPLSSPEPEKYGRWLLIRRGVSDASEAAYFACGGPPGAGLADLVRVAGSRWAIEDLFELAKGDCGLDEYEVRSWVGWHRHVTLSLFALAALTVIRSRAARPRRRKKGASAHPADRPRGAEVAAPAGVGPADAGRAGSDVVGVAEGAPAAGARVPLPQTQGNAARWVTTAVGLRNPCYSARETTPGRRPFRGVAKHCLRGIQEPEAQGSSFL